MVENTDNYSVTQAQLEHLDDTDLYATAWQEALQKQQQQNKKNGKAALKWGGRGQGGRGLSRRTFQPSDIVVPSVRLEYVGRSAAARDARVLLENGTIKLLSGHVYALIGRNGCGKSTLLRRMEAGKIPGFPPHVSTFHIPQEDVSVNTKMDDSEVTAVEELLQRYQTYCRETVQVAGKAHLQELETAMEELDLNHCSPDNNPDVMKRMEDLGEAISLLEEELSENGIAEINGVIRHQAEEALAFMGISSSDSSCPLSKLTAGQRKKVSLSLALMACTWASCDLLLLDEPTNALDISGLLQLRQLVQIVSSNKKRRPTTVLLVSHDCDFVNDVATDIIEFRKNLTLQYYAGNYADYLVQREQQDRHEHNRANALDKKEDAMKQTLDNLKKQAAPRRGGKKKKSKQITSFKKKMERELGDNDYEGDPVTSSFVVRRTAKWKRPEGEPDKAIQFNFRNCTSRWNEPLLFAMDVGFGYNVTTATDGEGIKCDLVKHHEPQLQDTEQSRPSVILKKDGYLFDCVDLCIQEGGIYCIVGDNASGTSTLLKILAKRIEPVEGKVDYALNVDVAFLNQDRVLNILDETGTALSYLSGKFPAKTEQEIRGELTAFGLSPKQASTDLHFLSGGERCRLCLTEIMLGNPQVLCLDQCTANLDVESVDALIYGIKRWNGTVVMVSHDAYFLRSLDVQCYALVAEEGKLRRVEGGIDAYLRSFGGST